MPPGVVIKIRYGDDAHYVQPKNDYHNTAHADEDSTHIVKSLPYSASGSPERDEHNAETEYKSQPVEESTPAAYVRLDFGIGDYLATKIANIHWDQREDAR